MAGFGLERTSKGNFDNFRSASQPEPGSGWMVGKYEFAMNVNEQGDIIIVHYDGDDYEAAIQAARKELGSRYEKRTVLVMPSTGMAGHFRRDKIIERQGDSEGVPPLPPSGRTKEAP